MRLGVLDIGSNTGHLLVFDAHYGAAPIPAFSHKEPLRLTEQVVGGRVGEDGVAALIDFVAESVQVAEDKGCEEVTGFATSAVRDADNTDEVLARVLERTGVRLQVLPGEDEARLTYLAVRRWFGWSTGRLAVFDIGGGSLEIAAGAAEVPDVARSLPLGAARLTRDRLSQGHDHATVRAVRKDIRAAIAREAGAIRRTGQPDRAVASSKTMRSLARICGAAPSSEGEFVRRWLPADELSSWIPKLASMSTQEVAGLPGVSGARAHQMLAGALVADAIMDIFEVEELQVCPWALREGVVLERLDHLARLEQSS